MCVFLDTLLQNATCSSLATRGLLFQREVANLYRHFPAIPSDPESLFVGVADPVAVQQGKVLAALDQIILKLGGSPHKPIE